MFLVELIASSFLDLISKQAGPDAAVSAFLLWQECGGKYNKIAEIQIKPKAKRRWTGRTWRELIH